MQATFTDGKIAESSSKDLSEYLIAIANTPRHNPIKQEIANRRADIIKRLLVAKQTEDLHSEFQGAARVALFVAFAALVL